MSRMAKISELIKPTDYDQRMTSWRANLRAFADQRLGWKITTTKNGLCLRMEIWWGFLTRERLLKRRYSFSICCSTSGFFILSFPCSNFIEWCRRRVHGPNWTHCPREKVNFIEARMQLLYGRPGDRMVLRVPCFVIFPNGSNTRFEFLVDTGATVCTLPEEYFSKFPVVTAADTEYANGDIEEEKPIAAMEIEFSGKRFRRIFVSWKGENKNKWRQLSPHSPSTQITSTCLHSPPCTSPAPPPWSL